MVRWEFKFNPFVWCYYLLTIYHFILDGWQKKTNWKGGQIFIPWQKRMQDIANEGRWLIFKNTGEIQLIFLCRWHVFLLSPNKKEKRKQVSWHPLEHFYPIPRDKPSLVEILSQLISRSRGCTRGRIRRGLEVAFIWS